MESALYVAPPSCLSTVYTTIARLKEAVNELGQEYVPICFDMGLLTKAFDIFWADPSQLHNVILMEGGMHLIMSVISGIGQLYVDTGLSNLLCDSCVFAAGTVEHMLTDKDYDRAIHGLELVEEALCAQFLVQFHRWCTLQDVSFFAPLQDWLQSFQTCFQSREDLSLLVDHLCSTLQKDVEPHISAFIADGKAMTPTFKVWVDLLFEVLRPLKFVISATRDGVWFAHQAAKAEFLPLLFA